MTKLAQFLVGSRDRLRGIDNNLAVMREALADHGFVEFESPPNGTREATFGCLHRLVEHVTGTGDAVVVYFTGHGGLARFIDDAGGASRIHRYLTTSDPHHSSRDFRGILDIEISAILDQLAAFSDNVTLILECCYAGGMADSLDARALGTVAVHEFPRPRWLARTEPRPAEGPRRPPLIVAATQEARSAEESMRPPFIGHFTHELAKALRDSCGRSISWARLIARVRHGVAARIGGTRQVPHVIGPAGREVLGWAAIDASHEHDLIVGTEGAWLLAGRLHGLGDGDEIEVIDLTGTSLSVATLRDVELDRARVVTRNASLDSPGVLRGLLRACSAPLEVRLAGPEHSAAMLELRRALARSVWLREAAHADTPHSVAIDDEGGIVVRGPAISRSRCSEPDVGSAVAWVVADLESLARRLRFVGACERAPSLPEGLHFDVHVEGRGGSCELPAQGGVVWRQSDRIRVVMRHDAGLAAETVFVNLVDEGVCGRLQLVAEGRPGGFNLPSEHRDDDAPLHDITFALTWPRDVPEQPRHETLWFVVASRPIDLRGIGFAPPERSFSADSMKGSSLEAPTRPLAWSVHRVEFELHPGARPS